MRKHILSIYKQTKTSANIPISWIFGTKRRQSQRRIDGNNVKDFCYGWGKFIALIKQRKNNE